MKKIIFIVAHFIIVQTYAQCNIVADNANAQNEEKSFTVDTKAQCDDCYLWTAPTLQILGNNKQNKVTVKNINTESSEISVLVLTADGIKECKKTLETTSSETPIPQTTKCGITIKDFKEVQVDSETLSFFPNENQFDYSYRWTVVYKNGDKKESSEKIPQFNISENNNITDTKLQVISKSPICSITISKNYPDSFWFQKEKIKIEQKMYLQSDYVEPQKSVDDKTK